MCLAHFNEPVLTYDGLSRLIGYGEDQHDCYLLMRTPDKEMYWHTAVGGHYFLDRIAKSGVTYANNGEIWTDLIRLDGDLTRAGAPRAKTFTIEIETEEKVA